MSYAGQETSIEGGSPLELYVFQIGTETYNITSGPDLVTYNSVDYTPVEIDRQTISVSDDERSEVLEITLPGTHPLVRKYINVAPGQRATMTILRAHRTDGTNQMITIFKGVVRSVGFTFDGLKSKIAVMPISGALSRPVPRFTYQGLCNHVLFDPRCTVPGSSFQYTGNVTAQSGDTLTVSGLSVKGSGWATGGFVATNSLDYRLVIAHSGDNVRLLLPFSNSPLGGSVDVFAGCAHDIATCKTKFNNVTNFGGFAFVPLINPFSTGIS